MSTEVPTPDTQVGDREVAESSWSRAGYPLVALFLVVAVCAIMTAMASPIVGGLTSGRVRVIDLALCMLCTSFLGAGIGAFVGLYHFRRMRGLGIGVVTGFCVGLLVGPIAMSPGLDETVISCVGGSVVVVGIGLTYRLTR